MKTLASLTLILLLTSCASKKQPLAVSDPGIPEEKFYLLYADKMECGVTTVNGIDISPRAMMTAYPNCKMEYKGNAEIRLYLLDCTQENQVGNVLIYTKDLESCIKTKVILQELKQHPGYPGLHNNQDYQSDIKL